MVRIRVKVKVRVGKLRCGVEGRWCYVGGIWRKLRRFSNERRGNCGGWNNRGQWCAAEGYTVRR
jgi:hypothetical protein